MAASVQCREMKLLRELLEPHKSHFFLDKLSLNLDLQFYKKKDDIIGISM